MIIPLNTLKTAAGYNPTAVFVLDAAVLIYSG